MKDYFEVSRKYILSVGSSGSDEPIEIPADEPFEPGIGEYRRRIEYASDSFQELGFSNNSRFVLPDQVYFEICHDEHISHNARTNGTDIYFRDSLGELLPCEMVSYNPMVKGAWWIKVNSTVKLNRIIYIYYGDHSRLPDEPCNIWAGENDYDNTLVLHNGLSSDSRYTLTHANTRHESLMTCMRYAPNYKSINKRQHSLIRYGFLDLSAKDKELHLVYDKFTAFFDTESNCWDVTEHSRNSLLSTRMDIRDYPIDRDSVQDAISSPISYLDGSVIETTPPSNTIIVLTSNYLTRITLNLGSTVNSALCFTTGGFETEFMCEPLLNGSNDFTFSGDDCVVSGSFVEFRPEKYTTYILYIGPDDTPYHIIVTKVRAPYIPHLLVVDVDRSLSSSETIGMKHVYYDWVSDSIIASANVTVESHTKRDNVNVMCEENRCFFNRSNNEDSAYLNLTTHTSNESIRPYELRTNVTSFGNALLTNTSNYVGSVNEIKSLYAIMHHQDRIRSISEAPASQGGQQLLLL